MQFFRSVIHFLYPVGIVHNRLQDIEIVQRGWHNRLRHLHNIVNIIFWHNNQKIKKALIFQSIYSILSMKRR